MPRYLDDQAAKEHQGCKGVYRAVRRASGGYSVTLEVPWLQRPNGLAFSPDGRTLYVSDSTIRTPSWSCFAIGPDGKLQLCETLLLCAARPLKH